MNKKLLIPIFFIICTAVAVTSCMKESSYASGPVHKESTSGSNILINGGFEEGDEKPRGWFTKNQYLDDSSGWATDEVHSGRRSIKIENIGASGACWEGSPVVFATAANGFSASVWFKTRNVGKGSGKCLMAFDVYLKNDMDGGAVHRVFADIPDAGNEWQKVSRQFVFASDISKIVPFCVLSGATGTVWFDDISAFPTYTDLKAKTLFDSRNGMFAGKYEKSKDGIHVFKGRQTVFSSDYIPAGHEGIYVLSGKFKSSGSEPSRMYFGLAQYTYDKKLITPESMHFVSGTDTILSKDCRPSDEIIHVEDGRNWVKSKDGCIAFDTDGEGGLKDLPNFNLSGFGISEIRYVDRQHCQVHLSIPVNKAYPAGTRIREHFSADQYLYVNRSNPLVPSKWTDYEEIITAGDIEAGYPRLYPCTKFIRLVILANYQSHDDRSVLSARDMKLAISSDDPHLLMNAGRLHSMSNLPEPKSKDL